MKNRSAVSWSSAGLLLLLAAAPAQTTAVLTVAPLQKLTVRRDENPAQALKVSLAAGYHANSNTPTESYMIPMKLTWDQGALEAAEVAYPKPKMQKFGFTDKPISVFDGDFEIMTKFRRAAGATPGPAILTGKLRYQACNDKMCLPPKNVEIKLPLLLQ
jgi:hypothetical protein